MNTTTVLYAEDDENDAFLARRAFKQAEVVNPLQIVRNGQQAVDYLSGTGPYASRREFPMPCLLLLDINQSGAGLQVPAKLFEYIRIGRPVLAFTAAGSPVARILARAGTPHMVIDPAEPSAAMDRQVAAFLRLSAEPVRASDWFWSEFDAARQAETLSGMLGGITGMMEPTKAFVMLDLRESIVCTDGI